MKELFFDPIRNFAFVDAGEFPYREYMDITEASRARIANLTWNDEIQTKAVTSLDNFHIILSRGEISLPDPFENIIDEIENIIDQADPDDLPCLREWDWSDGEWECLNDHTACMWNDGSNTCYHDGNLLSPLAEEDADPDSI